MFQDIVKKTKKAYRKKKTAEQIWFNKEGHIENQRLERLYGKSDPTCLVFKIDPTCLVLESDPTCLVFREWPTMPRFESDPTCIVLERPNMPRFRE